ncbi:MAG: outer membrane translocation and assembly module TamA [Granulosicoccus sp.]|jgi:outer membrane translocation and assembly module TamA
MNCNSAIRYTFFVFFILLLGTSCGTLKHLEEGETMLRKNKIEIKEKKNVDNAKGLEYELGSKIFQKPNSKFLGVLPSFGPWYYYRIQAKSDTTWWGRFMLKNFAEVPAVYSLEKADRSAENMENALRNKGYYNAEVDFETNKKGLRKKKMHVTYNIKTGKRYYLEEVNFTSKDTAIHKILQEIKSETLLPPGAPASESSYEQETRRITLYLLNNGYANFYKKYFSKFQLDAFSKDSLDHQLRNVGLEVLLPKDSSQHKTYTIGKVTVISMYDENGNPIMTQDSVFNNTHFYVGGGKHFIKLKALERKIFLREGDIYRLENVNKTRVQLGSLDIFQFVNIKRSVSEKSDSILNYEIRLIPKKRQEFGVDFEFNNSRIVTTSNAFVGTAAAISYRNRNIFRGGEIFTARAEGGIEVIPRQNFSLNAWNINLNFSMDFPKYHDLLKTDKYILSPIFIPFANARNRFYQKLKEEGVTSTSLKYNVLANTGNYRIDIFAGAWGWKFRPNNNWDIALNKVGIDFLDPVLSQSFRDSVISKNAYLERSFRSQLFTGGIFRDLNVVYQKDIGRGGKHSWLARGNLEVSGLEVWLINQARNIGNVFGDDVTFKLANKYEFSQYAKIEGDFRYYIKGRGGRLFASRLNIGIAGDFGFSDEVPYVKQFAVGAPNSMRGWRLRELGPGSYVDPDVDESTTNFYQTGDFKIEANFEYRFHILWYLKGAVFVDAGNIWSLSKDDERDGAGIGKASDVLKEMAVNTGFGLRLDVEYFILRFDLGYRLRSPFPDATGDHRLVRRNNLKKDLALDRFRGSLSVGYPF